MENDREGEIHCGNRVKYFGLKQENRRENYNVKQSPEVKQFEDANEILFGHRVPRIHSRW